jgi:hypothetical protein
VCALLSETQAIAVAQRLPLLISSSSAVRGIVALLEAARRAAARSVNALMTATYWEIGRRIVEFDVLKPYKATIDRSMLSAIPARIWAMASSRR